MESLCMHEEYTWRVCVYMEIMHGEFVCADCKAAGSLCWQ